MPCPLAVIFQHGFGRKHISNTFILKIKLQGFLIIWLEILVHFKFFLSQCHIQGLMGDIIQKFPILSLAATQREVCTAWNDGRATLAATMVRKFMWPKAGNSEGKGRSYWVPNSHHCVLFPLHNGVSWVWCISPHFCISCLFCCSASFNFLFVCKSQLSF